ncbi:hypothetical protein OH77DRAFT_1585680 [Trametes cingulata]|nr:hypothetical protein OH77DRAFT_1585680 [Trametes cingulata]
MSSTAPTAPSTPTPGPLQAWKEPTAQALPPRAASGSPGPTYAQVVSAGMGAGRASPPRQTASPHASALKNPAFDPMWGSQAVDFPDGAPLLHQPQPQTAPPVPTFLTQGDRASPTAFEDPVPAASPSADDPTTPPPSPGLGTACWPDDLVVEGSSQTPTPDLLDALGEHGANGGSILDFITDGIGPDGRPLPGREADWSVRRQKKRPRAHSWSPPPRPAPGQRRLIIFDRAEERSGLMPLLPPPSPVLQPTEPPPVWMKHFAFASPHPPPSIRTARDERDAQRKLFLQETEELVAMYEDGTLTPPADAPLPPADLPVADPPTPVPAPAQPLADMAMDVDPVRSAMPLQSAPRAHGRPTIMQPAKSLPLRACDMNRAAPGLPTRTRRSDLPASSQPEFAASTPAARPGRLPRLPGTSLLGTAVRPAVLSPPRRPAPPVRVGTPFPTMFTREHSPLPLHMPQRLPDPQEPGRRDAALRTTVPIMPPPGRTADHVPYTSVLATLTPLTPAPASVGPVFTPPPVAGFELPVQPDPEQLLLGMPRARVAALWGEESDTLALLHLWSVGYPRPAQIQLLTDALAAALYAITGDVDPFLIPPEQDWTVPVAQRILPITWVVLRLSKAGTRKLLDGKVWSTPAITFFAYPRAIPIPRYLFTLSGFAHDRDSDIISTVWATITGAKALPATLALLQENPDYEDDTLEAAAEIVLSGLEVTVYRLQNGNLNAAVFCGSPTASVPRWREWRNLLANLPYTSNFNTTGFARRPALCDACHGADHPTHKCPYPDVPGWNAPAPGNGPTFPSPDAPFPSGPSAGARGGQRGGPSSSGRGSAPNRGNRGGSRRAGMGGRDSQANRENAPY